MSASTPKVKTYRGKYVLRNSWRENKLVHTRYLAKVSQHTDGRDHNFDHLTMKRNQFWIRKLFFTAKVNSVQEACAKCLAVHISKFEILQTTWKNKTKTKNIKILDLLMRNWKLIVWCSLFHLFHVICKISNFNLWTARHLVQASSIELTLKE